MKRPNLILMPTMDCLALTKQAIETCLAQDIPTEVLVIDASSQDGTQEYLRTLHPKVAVATLPRDAGVSIAWNVGLEIAFDHQKRGQVLVVNNDIRLRPDAYRLLIEDGGSFVTCVGTSSGAQFPGGTPTGDRRPHPDFSCFLIRKECWDRVGRFDESMRIYCSDGDYHLRMHKAGIASYCLDVPFYHYASGTLKNVGNDDRTRVCKQAERDRAAFEKKWGVAMGTTEYYKLFNGHSPDQHRQAPEEHANPA